MSGPAPGRGCARASPAATRRRRRRTHLRPRSAHRRDRRSYRALLYSGGAIAAAARAHGREQGRHLIGVVVGHRVAVGLRRRSERPEVRTNVRMAVVAHVGVPQERSEGVGCLLFQCLDDGRAPGGIQRLECRTLGLGQPRGMREGLAERCRERRSSAALPARNAATPSAPAAGTRPSALAGMISSSRADSRRPSASLQREELLMRCPAARDIHPPGARPHPWPRPATGSHPRTSACQRPMRRRGPARSPASRWPARPGWRFQTEPRPPKSDVPPITAAPIAFEQQGARPRRR